MRCHGFEVPYSERTVGIILISWRKRELVQIYTMVKNKEGLLNELRNVHRNGLINDEEFVLLKQLILSETVTPEIEFQFKKMFPDKKKIESETKSENPYDYLAKLFGRDLRKRKIKSEN